jgi:hypothetical protein
VLLLGDVCRRAGVFFEGEQVAGLAIQRLAQSLERAETNGSGFDGFEHGEILRRDPDQFSKP